MTEKNEKTSEEREMPCFGQKGMKEMMNKCCEDIGGPDESSAPMCGCMKNCKYFPLMPVVFGIAFFLLGYFLDAEITRVLWLAGAALLVLMGGFALVMMSRMKKMCCS